MTQPRDYYEVLGIRRGATEDEIRRAYRSLARKHHPDVSKDPDAAQRFHEISEAYEVLTDKEKRQAYDRFGHAGVGAGPSVGAAGSGFGGQGSKVWSTSEGFGGPIPSDFSDLFEQMFSGAESPFRTRPAPRPERQGQDVATDVAVGFLTAALGGTEEVSIRGPLGPQRISVKIPPGIESGAKLRVKGKGGQGAPGAAAGDLIVTITVGEHPLFSRQGLDILIDVPITLAEAGLGATVKVPLLKGSVEIKVPAGASSGQKLRVKGKGITDAKGRRGDFLAVIQIVAPAELSDRGRALLQELAGELQNPRKSGPWPAT